MIRLGVTKDLPELMDLLLVFHAEGGLFPLDAEKVIKECQELIEEERLFLAVRDGTLAGALGIVENVPWYGRGIFLADRFFFVLPEFRADGIGRELLAAAEAYAEACGLFFILTVTNPDRALKRGRIADVVGWAPLGHCVRVT